MTIPRPRMRTIAPLRTARGYITRSAEGVSNLRPSDALVALAPLQRAIPSGPSPAFPEREVPGTLKGHVATAVLTVLAEGGPAQRVMTDDSRHAGTVGVVRREPKTTVASKVPPLCPRDALIQRVMTEAGTRLRRARRAGRSGEPAAARGSSGGASCGGCCSAPARRRAEGGPCPCRPGSGRPSPGGPARRCSPSP